MNILNISLLIFAALIWVAVPLTKYFDEKDERERQHRRSH